MVLTRSTSLKPKHNACSCCVDDGPQPPKRAKGAPTKRSLPGTPLALQIKSFEKVLAAVRDRKGTNQPNTDETAADVKEETVEQVEDNVECNNNWQASQSTLSNKLSYLLFNKVLSDVTFWVGKDSVQQEIFAHRFVLSMSSTVFDAMFNGPTRLQGDTIVLPHSEPEALRSFLKFIYTEQADIESKTALGILYLAKKYEVVALEKLCLDYLEKNLSPNNAVSLLKHGLELNKEELIEQSLQMIEKNPKLYVLSPDFVDLSQDALCRIIERSTLTLSEDYIFRVAKSWAMSRCGKMNLPPTPENQRKALGRALYLIRFPLMSLEDFSKWVVGSGWLSDEETLEMFKHLAGAGTSPGSVEKPLPFSSEPRKSPQQSVKIFSTIGCREKVALKNVTKVDFELCFHTSRPIFLDAFGMNLSPDAGTTHEISLSLRRVSGSTVAFSKTTISSPSDAKTNCSARIDLSKSVHLQAGVIYHVHGSVTLSRAGFSFKKLKCLSHVNQDVPQFGNVSFYFVPATSCIAVDRHPLVFQGLLNRVFFHY